MFKIFSLFLLLCCVACSSNKPPKDLPTKFNTRISQSGLKHFELRYIAKPKPEEQRKKKRSGRRKPKSNPAKLYQNTLEQMTKDAESIVASTGYCKEGFWVLNFQFNAQSPRLRGECNDTASAEDRKQYPDTLKKW